MFLMSLLALDLARNNVQLRSHELGLLDGEQKRVLTKSRSFSASPMTLMLFWRSASSMTSGGANRILDVENVLTRYLWGVVTRNRTC